MPIGNPRLQVRLEPETIQWLKEYAQRNNTTMSEILREYVEILKREDRRQKARANAAS